MKLTVALLASCLLAPAQSVTASITQAQAALAQAYTSATALVSQNAALANPTGVVRYYQRAGPNWDPYTTSTDPTMQMTIRNAVLRLATYTPFFDTRLVWMPRAHVYFDSYAIYPADPTATQHPEWILKDAAGNKLYIPYACNASSCAQYAGDISNAAFRSFQVSAMQAFQKGGGATTAGYAGLWIDDVNMAMMVGDGTGALVAPIDPATHVAMTVTAWQTYFRNYVAQIRAALPGVEILHNSVWTMGNPLTNPLVAGQMAAADLINVERGFGDGGITGGTGMYSLYALMNFIDAVHTTGKPVVIENLYLADQMYALACYFLIQNGKDYFSILEQTPGNWPVNLYRTNLGTANGARFQVSPGLWRRNFAYGFVLANEPSAATQAIPLPPGMLDPDGLPVSSVTLAAKQGAVFQVIH